MIEKVKTLLLVLLVIGSIVLSFGIWGITPQYESVDVPQYTTANITDPTNQRNVSNVTMPRSVTLHFGGQKHTVVFPGQSGYQDALTVLHQAAFSNITITNDYGEAEWRKIVNDMESLQIDFDVDLPATVFDQSDLTNLHSRVDPSMQIRTIYLFKSPDDSDMRALFYSGPDNRMYVARVIVPKDAYQKLFAGLKSAPAYAMYGQSLERNFYLPVEPILLQTYTIEAVQGPHNQGIIDSLFVDSSLTRKVLEHDGSQIITDGTRLVRVVAQDQSLEYRNIGLDRNYGDVVEAEFAIQHATNFVNDHGGFVGQGLVMLHEVRTNPEHLRSRRSYTFRPYVNGLPVIGDPASIYVDVVDTDVATMKRSEINVGPRKNKDKEVTMQSGAQLLKNVEADTWLDRNKITSVYPAYLVGAIREQVAELRPVWVVEEAGEGRNALFDAVTGELLSSVGGI